jgi:hypothetical protein
MKDLPAMKNLSEATDKDHATSNSSIMIPLFSGGNLEE